MQSTPYVRLLLARNRHDCQIIILAKIANLTLFYYVTFMRFHDGITFERISGSKGPVCKNLEMGHFFYIWPFRIELFFGLVKSARNSSSQVDTSTLSPSAWLEILELLSRRSTLQVYFKSSESSLEASSLLELMEQLVNSRLSLSNGLVCTRLHVLIWRPLFIHMYILQNVRMVGDVHHFVAYTHLNYVIIPLASSRLIGRVRIERKFLLSMRTRFSLFATIPSTSCNLNMSSDLSSPS